MTFMLLCCGVLAPALSAQETMPMVSLAQAKLIAAGAREYADKHHWTIAIAVVNNEGSLVYFERADKAQQGSIDGAIAKAKSSNAHRRPTRVFAEDVKKGRVGLVTMANVVAVEGGLPIIINGVHVGAIGVSGAHAAQDEECASAGLEKLK